jgi:hypothetical protein
MDGCFWIAPVSAALLLTASGAVTAGGGSAADGQALERRLVGLEAEVDALRAAAEPDHWLTRRRAEEIRALAGDVLADADQRAALQAGGLCAGHDGRFFIASADGSFRLSLLGQVQTRFVFNHQDAASEGDSARWGFENTRTRFGILGHAIDPTWRFGLWSGWLANGTPWLVEAWIKKDLGGGWNLQLGQFKIPVWREWLVVEMRQQFADRSLLTARHAGAGKGVQLNHRGEALSLSAAITDGTWTWNTPWSAGPDQTRGTMPWQSSNECAFTVRGELLLAGDWSSCPDFEGWMGDDPLFLLGAAIHTQRGEYGTDDEESEILQWTVDASSKFGGASLFAAFIATHFDDGSVSRDEWGLLIQGGYFLDEHWEATARLEWGDLDGAGPVSDELMILTAGVNRFWARHALKWTIDLGYAFEPVDAQWGGAGVGWRADEPGRDGQVLLRTQLQVLY